MQTLKRFYKDVGIRPAESGHEIALDGRGVKTPMAVPLILPTRALAEAVAAEWSAQEENIVSTAMPLTQLTNTVLDRVRPARESFGAAVAAFARNDLICHRAETPADLVRRQDRLWSPLVDWAANRHGARLAVGYGVMPLAQPAEALIALDRSVRALDDWALAAAGAAAMAGDSLVLALALIQGHIDAESACQIALLDEIWQAERWGEDKEATARQNDTVTEIKAAARFAELSRP